MLFQKTVSDRAHLKAILREEAVPLILLCVFILYEECTGTHSGFPWVVKCRRGVVMAMLGSLAHLTASRLPIMGITEERAVEGTRTSDCPIIPQSQGVSALALWIFEVGCSWL